MSIAIFSEIGYRMASNNPEGNIITNERRFNSLFGVSPLVCYIAWEKIHTDSDSIEGEPKHMLWALLFLKTYCSEHALRAITGADEKTQRKWIWYYVDLLANLTVIDWNNRYADRNHGQTCLVSLDGTDFRIYEPTPFNRKWYSHKFHGPGVRYEIGLCIRTGHIVWAFGGFPCGAWPDLKLARYVFTDMLEEGERALADKGYRDEDYFINPTEVGINAARQKSIMARHETVNRRLKQFGVLSQRFRHKLVKHPRTFHAVVNLTQISIENGFSLFQI